MYLIRVWYDSARISDLNCLSNEPIPFLRDQPVSCQERVNRASYEASSWLWELGRVVALDATRNQLLFPQTDRSCLSRGLSLPINAAGLLSQGCHPTKCILLECKQRFEHQAHQTMCTYCQGEC